jgi:hypothetical protein
MTLEIESQDMTRSISWQISDLVAKIDGQIAGPPAPIVLDAPAGAGASEDADDSDASTTSKAESADKQEKP